MSFDGLGVQAKGSDETTEEDLCLNHFEKDVLIGGVRAGTRIEIGETFADVDLPIKHVGNPNGSCGMRLELHSDTVYWAVYIDEFLDYNFRCGVDLKSYIQNSRLGVILYVVIKFLVHRKCNH